jgi:hypothetical protein
VPASVGDADTAPTRLSHPTRIQLRRLPEDQRADVGAVSRLDPSGAVESNFSAPSSSRIRRSTYAEVDRDPRRVPEDLRAGVEALSGFDLSAVRVHPSSAEPAAIGALAYAQGPDIHLAPGQEQHLPHEAWHVVQQMQGRVRPIAQFTGRALNDDPDLEREADVMGARATRLGRRIVGAASTTARREPTVVAPSRSSPIQRSPTKKPGGDRDDPAYFESTHPEVELIRLERDVYRIKGTEQTVHWRGHKYWVKQAGPVPWTEFDMNAYAANPEFLDFTVMYKEVSAATSGGGGDADMKRALQLHVLQRFMVNALYSANEISKMNYQASPLNFQDGGSYIRSHATAFVGALKKMIGADIEDVHLVRSIDFNDIMAQFLDRFDAMDLSADISAKVDQIATFAIDRKGLEGFSDAYGMVFADVTKGLGVDSLPALQGVVEVAATRINKKIFDDTIVEVVKKYVAKEYADVDALQRDTVISELHAFVTGAGADLPTFLAYINPKKRRLLDEQKASDLAKLTASIDSTRGGDVDTLFDQFKQELGNYKKYLVALKSRPLDGSEQAFVDKRGDARTEFKALLQTDSFRTYLGTKRAPIEARTYTDLTAGDLKTGELKPLVELKGKLETGLPDITMVGGSIMVGDQPAVLLKKDTAEKLVDMVEFGLNKAGYVPTPTAASRKMLAMGASLKEIVTEIATRQKEVAKLGPTKDKIQRFIDEVTGFDPATYKSRLDAVDQLARTKRSFGLFEDLVRDSKTYVKLQAASVVKLIDGLQLLEPGSGLPAIALQELRVNLDDAITNKDDIAAFIRNIQNIHEALILALERDPVGAAGRVAHDLKIPSGAKSPHVTDYGLRAFAQAYNAVLAQHGDDNLAIDAYSSIYFELIQKLNQVKVTGETGITLRNPRDLAEFKKLGEGVHVVVKAPDLVLIDIHPNDASKALMARQQVVQLILAMFEGAKADYRSTVIVDITLNHVSDPAVKEIKDAAQKYIDSGQLNLVFIQSLTKFAEMGSDKQSGGLMFHYNDDKNWAAFNKSVAESAAVEKADPTAENYFRALLKYTESEQVRYIATIRENTKYVYDSLAREFARLRADPKTIELSVSDDPGACYVAFNYEELAARLFAGDKDRDVKTEGLGKRILNDAIYELVNKLELPLSMRQSFGFPISNLGEAWIGSRFTIGTETHGMLDEYIRIITYVKASLVSIDDATMKDDSKRRAKFKALSNDIASLNDLKKKLDALMLGK